MRIIFLLFLSGCVAYLSAQNSYHHFLDAHRGECQVSTRDSNGRVFIAGRHFISNFDRGFMLAEFDGNANMVQSKHFLMSVDPNTVTMRDIVTAANGDIYVLGDMQYDLPTPDTTFLLSFDASFNLNWGRKFMSPTGGSTKAYSMVEAPNGDVILGAYYSISPTSTTFLTRMDQSGTVIWNRTVASSGNPTRTLFPELHMVNNDDLIIAGHAYFQSEPGWIACMDPQGSYKWSKSFPVDFNFSRLLPKRIFNTANGYLIFHEGYFSTWESPGKIVEVDTLGQVIGHWDLIVDADSSGAFTDMQEDPAGGYVLVGSDFEGTNGKLWSLHLSDSLTVDWAWGYGLGGFAYGYVAQGLANGGYLFGGEGQALASQIVIKSFLVRTDATGATALCDSIMNASIVSRPLVGSTISMTTGQLPAGAGWAPIGVQPFGPLLELNACLSVGVSQGETAQEFVIGQNMNNGQVSVTTPTENWEHRLFMSNGALIRTWSSYGTNTHFQLISSGIFLLESTRGEERVLTRLVMP